MERFNSTPDVCCGISCGTSCSTVNCVDCLDLMNKVITCEKMSVGVVKETH